MVYDYIVSYAMILNDHIVSYEMIWNDYIVSYEMIWNDSIQQDIMRHNTPYLLLTPF